MPVTTLKRNKEQPVHLSGTTQTVRLDREDLLAGLVLRVAGVCTPAAALGTAVTDGILNYVRSIAVRTAAFDILKANGHAFYQLARILGGATPEVVDVGAGAAAYPFSGLFPIPFKQLNALIPFITALPAWAYQELSLEIEFGVLADLYTVGAGGAPLSALTCEVQKECAIPGPDEPALRNAATFALARLDRISKQVGATSTEFSVPLTAGRMKRALILSTTDAGVFQDDIATNIRVRRGSSEVVFDRISWAMLRALNAHDYGVAIPAGCAVIDFARDKDISNLLDCEGVDTVSLEADVTVGGGATMLYVDELDIQRSGIQ